MFVISFFYGFTREAFYTVLLLCLAISSVTVWLICAKLACSRMQAVLAAAIHTLSKAFVDYSTSGLENPLTHLLLVVFCFLYFQWMQNVLSPNLQNETNSLPDVPVAFRDRHIFWMTFVAALGTVNRMDTILLYLPALLSCP